MMQAIYLFLLFVSVSILFVQLAMPQKRNVHIAFAIFSGSIAMVAAQHLSGETLGPYRYLIGLGTCATCNGYWLVSRGLFREHKAIEKRHVAFALFIGLLIVGHQLLQMAGALSIFHTTQLMLLSSVLAKITALLSSTVLMLTVWEPIRGYSRSRGANRQQRMLFLMSCGGAIFACTVIAEGLLSEAQLQRLFPWFVAISAIQILLVTQTILIWQLRAGNSNEAHKSSAPNEQTTSEPAAHLLKAIEQILTQQKSYLQPNLKLKDLAIQLDVPEYKISRAIRHSFGALNFNQFINNFRVEHAKSLLTCAKTQHWTMLVVGLESGFASVESFNRAFKQHNGCTPKEFQTRHSIEMSEAYVAQ